MIETELTVRTAIRDAAMAALDSINTNKSGVYYSKQAFVSPTFDEETQCVGFPTFCVILTDEDLVHDMMSGATVQGKLMVIVYAKSEDDPRKALDQALQDAVRAMSNDPGLRAPLVQRIQLDSITTDEATRMAKPFAQAVMTWTVQFSRSMSFNG
jgi:hypothetical protein